MKNAGLLNTPVAVTDESAKTLIASYQNLGIAQVEGNLNDRKEASESGEVVGKMPNNAGADILGQEGEWYKIKSGEVEGYVKAEYLMTGNEAKAYAPSVMRVMATVQTDGLRVRSAPSMDAEVNMTISTGEELEVTDNSGEFIQVDVNGDVGYIHKDYVEVGTKLDHAITISELRYGKGVSDVRVALVTEALKYVGNPYVWGGTSLTKGADCSGYVLTLFAKYGVYLPHSSRAQAGYGRAIKPSEAQPGDLFFYGSGSISHVAIYIGGGKCVHAFSTNQGIKVTSAYYRTPICVRSILS